MKKRHGLRLFSVGVGLGIGLMLASSVAQARDSRESDEYDFSWLDPDKKIYVLQNRRYTKAGKPTVSLSGVYGLSQIYRSVIGFEPRVGYYFSEAWGFEAFYTKFSSSPNQHDRVLKDATSTIPAAVDLTSQMGAVIHWVPWYSKLNFFNQILYFDWSIVAGIGKLSADVDRNRTVGGTPDVVQKEYTAFFLGTTQQYHINKNWFARLDVLGAIYQREIFGDGGEKAWFSNFNVGLGAGYRF